MDIYPLWDDYQFRYISQKSYITNTKLDDDFKILDNIVRKSADFEGHIGCSKYKIKFITNLLNKYNIKTVAEIGFNAGHSAALFLNHPRKIKFLKSFYK